jgi:carbon monoxide dehydrogenase subunit G
MEIRGEIEIAAPAAEVWTLLGDRFDRIGEWASAIRESRSDPEALAPAGAPVGGRVCRTRVPGFAEVRERIVRWDAGEMDLEYELVDPPRVLARARNRLQVTPLAEERSIVRWAATVTPRGAIGRLLMLPLRARLRKLARRSMEDLRRHLERSRDTNAHRTVSVSRRIEAPAAVAWEVISDVVGFGDVAPNLSRAEVVSGEGVGMTRRCYDSRGRGWKETCTLWEEGHRYRMRVDTKTYPFPLRQMFRAFCGEWAVRPAGSDADVSMFYELELSPLGRMLWPLLRGKFAHQCEILLDNWERAITAKNLDPDPDKATEAGALEESRT